MISKVFIHCVLSMLLLFTTINSQQLRLGLTGAISKEIGPNIENFNWGFSAGGNIFFFLSKNALIGVQASYSRFTPDESQFTESIDDLFSGKVSGDAYIIEIVPSLRLTTAYSLSNINFFGQAGVGLYVINTLVTINGTRDDSQVQEIFGEEASGHLGFNIGGGFTLGKPDVITLDIYPVFNLVFLDNDQLMRYFSINIALGFGI